MRVTIEIEPEEAARFVKAFVPDAVHTAINNNPWQVDWAGDTTKWPQGWLDLMKSMGGIQK